MNEITKGPHWVLTVNYLTANEGSLGDLVFQKVVIAEAAAVKSAQYHSKTIRRFVFRYNTRGAAIMADTKLRSLLDPDHLRPAFEIREAAEVSPRGSGLFL